MAEPMSNNVMRTVARERKTYESIRDMNRYEIVDKIHDLEDRITELEDKCANTELDADFWKDKAERNAV